MAPRTRRSRGNRGVGTQGEGSITALWICNKWDRQRWCWLVVWNIWIIFPYIENVIIPTDFHIIQRGWNHQPVISSDWWWLTGTTCPSCGCKKEDVASRWYANGWTVKTPQTTEFSLRFFSFYPWFSHMLVLLYTIVKIGFLVLTM